MYGLGESLGASILIQATAREPVFRAIVAECPFADLRAIAEFRVPQVKRAGTSSQNSGERRHDLCQAALRTELCRSRTTLGDRG